MTHRDKTIGTKHQSIEGRKGEREKKEALVIMEPIVSGEKLYTATKGHHPSSQGIWENLNGENDIQQVLFMVLVVVDQGYKP